MYPYPPGHLLGLLLSPQCRTDFKPRTSVLPHALPILFLLCANIHWHAQTHLAHPLLWIVSKFYIPSNHNGSTSFIKPFLLTIFTSTILSLPYKYIAGVQLLAVVHLFSDSFYHTHKEKETTLKQLITRSYVINRTVYAIVFVYKTIAVHL